MDINPTSASYWSATADIGREAPKRPANSSGSASYWSATSQVGRADKTLVAESSFSNYRNQTNRAGSYQVQQTIADIDKGALNNALSTNLAFGDDRSISAQKGFFNNLRDRLTTLGGHLDNLSSLADFSPNIVKSSDPTRVTANAGIKADTITAKITITRLAQGHVAASQEQTDPFEALNLTGNFSINGYTIGVEAADSLADIRDKVNRGEDSNANGVLEDFNEDLNNNGKLDFYYSPPVWTGDGYQPAFSYYEDINKDGLITTSEDINGNERLDGGSDALRVEASIEGNHLLFTSSEGADKTLRIDDDDDILETLGFFRRTDDNEKVLLTTGENSYNKSPQSALFSVNGVNREAFTNEVKDVLDDITINLKKTTGREITLSVIKDPTEAASRVETFVEGYNSVAELIHDEGEKQVPVHNNSRVQDITRQLAFYTNRTVKSIETEPNALSDIGLTPQARPPEGLNLDALEAVNKRIETDSDSVFNGIKSMQEEIGLLSKLRKIGINSDEDFSLSIDNEKLQKSLRDDPKGIYDIFNTDPGGVAPRLSQTIKDATDQPNGFIEYELSTLDYYSRNKSDVIGATGLLERLNSEQNVKSLIGKVLV